MILSFSTRRGTGIPCHDLHRLLLPCPHLPCQLWLQPLPVELRIEQHLLRPQRRRHGSSRVWAQLAEHLKKEAQRLRLSLGVHLLHFGGKEIWRQFHPRFWALGGLSSYSCSRAVLSNPRRSGAGDRQPTSASDPLS